MKKTLSAIVLFVGFFFCCSSAAGQHSRTAADKHNLDDHLLTATMDCDSNLIKSLLEKGANIETRESHEGDTPLIMAATSCPTDTVKLLLGKGANKEAKNALGETALMMAVPSRQYLAVTLLLESGANIEAKGPGGKTPLMMASTKDFAQLLLDHGANIEARNDRGETVWMTAQTEELAQLFLDKGASIDAKDNRGETALLLCAEDGKVEGMTWLLSHGANIEAKNNLGETALLVAAGNRNTGVVKLLLAKGADIDVRDKSGRTALDNAKQKGPDELVELLEQATRKKDPSKMFAATLSAYRQNSKDESLREKVIQSASALPAFPAIPEEARQLFALAANQIKLASTPDALNQPIGLLRKVVEIAPWWGDAYYNLSRALEMCGQYDEAFDQLNYYLELKPSEADAREARAHLVAIQIEKNAAVGKKQ